MMLSDDFSDLTSLLLVEHIAATGSLTAAAEKSSMTVSAASQRLAKLERSIGQSLFVRLPRGMSPTEAGAAVIRRIGALRFEIRSIRGDLEAIQSLRAGSVRLGSFPTASASLVSDALREFIATWPDVQVSVRSGVFPDLLEVLESGEVDLAVLWSYDFTPPWPTSILVQPLMHDPMHLLVSATSSSATTIALAELSDASWIVRQDQHPATQVLLRSCARAGFEPRVVYEANDYQEVQAMVSAGVGVAMVPGLALDQLRADVRKLAFTKNSAVPARQISLGTLDRRSLSPSMVAMTRCLQRAARALSGA
ncbi:LysR family transcriptional regulator [Epidermidibacterium keratini]|uniref:LysR family transcriptional regulator n=1 Tax=Epidermidibacterium keratini TaxID=1891644 RepID=UPI001CEF6470|nr:LysR family transcriptional regulator [Epidermidibacterium keratini]